ncbi:cytochrome c biogenesis protein CcdA [Nocardiopsis dassonvillei]|uniref:cytochrome c biogenesis CcdA family protein n=1 Tax=Nocardiopsis dassonvillei TaxID=2014 RepID=UPI00200D76F7|nr:cytochrome c biogenesis protein CcdA [Nocardiopsis dassonvillei]MCK9871389.1 cytochrome c biogenesis protein CcdA [Nocardiopsis dassonvillei]
MDPIGSTVLGGSLLLAAPLALAAGLVSFLSPCVLPLVPGYLSYASGMSGAAVEQRRAAGSAAGGSAVEEIDEDLARNRRTMVLGSLLFVAGFTLVFVSVGGFVGWLGDLLIDYTEPITRVLGALTILLGLAFMGLIPGMGREFRFHRAPRAGLAGAPLLGILFGLGWTPCIGPTLAAVQSLAFTEGGVGRGMLLSLFYCLGLGAPFILASALYRRALTAFTWLRRRTRTIMVAGGAMLVLIGAAMVTGLWAELTVIAQGWTAGFRTVI